MSLFSSSRSVLILSDEGLQIYVVGRLNAKFIDFVPWNTVEFENSVRDILVKKCKRKPIVILNDMVEQHYRKERIPKVGMMDQANVLKRRLNVAFPNYKIRAALKLDDKKSNLPKDGKGAAYLFAAVPAADSFAKTMQAVRLSNAAVIGFYLLPVESSSMVKVLSAKISKTKRGTATWAIFMGQHHGGGIRQIVTRDGELALTRMSPIVDTDVEPGLWAKEVSGELSATMSYLSRFGYKDSDGLNVIIIANEGTEQYIENAINIDCNLNILTSQEAGKILGVNVGGQSDYRYADPLHAAYLGQKSKFLLPMQVAAIDSMVKPRRIATFIIIGLLGGFGYFGFNAFTEWSKLLQIEDEIRIAEEQKKSIKQEYDLQLAKKKEIGFDFVLVNNSVELFNGFEKDKIQSFPVLQAIGEALGSDLRLDKITVKSEKLKQETSNQDPYYDQSKAEDKIIINAVMSLSYDKSISADLGVQKTNTLKERLQQNLPNYDVSIIRQVADLSYTGNFVGEAGNFDTDPSKQQNYQAEISVRGPLR